MLWSKMIREWKTTVLRETRVHTDHISKHIWGKYELMNKSRCYCSSPRERSVMRPSQGIPVPLLD